MEVFCSRKMYYADPDSETMLYARACHFTPPADSSGDDGDLLKEEAGSMLEDWPWRLKAAGIDPSFAKLLVDCLRRAGMSEAVADGLLTSLCIRIDKESPSPREVIRLCREFIDRHLKNEARLYAAASLALQRWEAAPSV